MVEDSGADASFPFQHPWMQILTRRSAALFLHIVWNFSENSFISMKIQTFMGCGMFFWLVER